MVIIILFSIIFIISIFNYTIFLFFLSIIFSRFFLFTLFILCIFFRVVLILIIIIINFFLRICIRIFFSILFCQTITIFILCFFLFFSTIQILNISISRIRFFLFRIFSSVITFIIIFSLTFRILILITFSVILFSLLFSIRTKIIRIFTVFTIIISIIISLIYISIIFSFSIFFFATLFTILSNRFFTTLEIFPVNFSITFARIRRGRVFKIISIVQTTTCSLSRIFTLAWFSIILIVFIFISFEFRYLLIDNFFTFQRRAIQSSAYSFNHIILIKSSSIYLPIDHYKREFPRKPIIRIFLYKFQLFSMYRISIILIIFYTLTNLISLKI